MIFKSAALSLVLASASAKLTGRRHLQSDRKCTSPTLPELTDATVDILASVFGGEDIVDAYEQYQEDGNTVGSNTALLCEAADASATGLLPVDGESGDTDFPFGNIKAIMTMGERSVCEDSEGQKLVGVPDGMGAYLVDDDTVRVVFQSESYGPIRQESFPVKMNDDTFTMGGSHVQYVDYERDLMANFMNHDGPASDMVVGVGNMIKEAYNLKGERIGPRASSGPTATGAHYGNCDADGNYVVTEVPHEADWFFQSFCSAHLEQKHQWGEGIGLEDDIFMTLEEWINYAPGSNFVGLAGQALDIKNKAIHALGVLTQGGFEKIVEMNPQHPDYVMFSVSGYTGNFGSAEMTQVELDARNANYTREDGKPWVWTKDITPARIYVGVKGKLEDGSDAPEDDFLARNGLKYGKMYGYAVDMGEPLRQSQGMWRDAFHKDPQYGVNGGRVGGFWIAQKWQWDGVVRNFAHDGSWDYQDKPPHTGSGSGRKKFEYWTAAGPDKKGCKTEHNSPDPRKGITGFIQSSTCGYFGHYYVNDVAEVLAAANGELPDVFDGDYFVYQGEVDIREQVNLGGKGQTANGADATVNHSDMENPHVTFEDIDGFEVLEGPDDKLYAVIQEDSGNKLGERMFIAPLEHGRDGKELSYYFVAQSGGAENTRFKNGVGIPKGSWSKPNGHEFSGVFDMSALFAKNADGTYKLAASDTGEVKREADRQTDINEKHVMVNVQAHTQVGGVLSAFQLDRGGQIYLYKPDIPTVTLTGLNTPPGLVEAVERAIP